MRVSYKVIGRNLRAARKKAEFTQEKAAELLGMSTLHYGRLERGERPVSLDQIANAAEAMNVPIYELLDGMSSNAVFSPSPKCTQKLQLGLIIDFLSIGCSDDARGMMLDVCKLIAERDKYRR